MSTFYRLFKTCFGPKREDKTLPCLRISAYSTHSKCDQCLALSSFQRSSQTEEQLAFAKSLKMAHKRCYGAARNYIENLRHSAISDPESRLFLQLDDMDNSKSYLPRILEPGKKTGKIFQLPSKITGTIMYSGKYIGNRKVNMFINHNNFEQGGNKVVSILYLLLKDFISDHKFLPKKLHINADNCWRENKNIYVFSFLAALVQLKIFEEVTMEFLLVGHTGNQCDQLFSILTEEFKSEIRTVEELMMKIRNSPISPKPIVHHLLFIHDWKDFVIPNLTEKGLKNHSHYNSFQFKAEKGLVNLRAKKYPHYAEWYPHEGIQLLKDEIDFTPVPVAEFRPDDLNLDKVLADLRKIYFPLMPIKDQKRVSESWEKLCNTLEQMHRKHLPPMQIMEILKQLPTAIPGLPQALQQFQDKEDNPPALVGELRPPAVEESSFDKEMKIGLDVVIWTLSKKDRPWVGRVSKIVSPNEFEIHWFQRKNRSNVFWALKNKDGTPFISIFSLKPMDFEFIG